MKIDASLKIGIIGLGYVGLPLAVEEFGRRSKHLDLTLIH